MGEPSERPRPRFTVSIQVYVALVFVALGLIVGGATTAMGYNAVKSLAVEAGYRIFGDYARVVAGTIAASRAHISRDLQTIVDERTVSSLQLMQLLGETPQLESLYVRYANGTVFGVRRTPRGFSVRSVPVRSLDPRARSWLDDARGTVESSPPYVFTTTHTTGTTLTLRGANGNVAAADVDLDFLSHLLARDRPIARARAAIVDQDGTVIASSETGRTPLAHVEAFGAPLAAAFAAAGVHPTARGTVRDEHGAAWLYAAAFPNQMRTGVRRVFVVAPEDELIGAARAIRDRMLLLCATILLVWLPVAWWIASLVARPLRRLDAEAEALRNLDFSDRPRETSNIAEIEDLAETFDAMRRRMRSYNEAARRFIPFEFLLHLHRPDIVALELGDHREYEMAVFFADIRAFTSLSESLTPRESFAFLNDYLGRVGPVVREYGGFVDKYVGDAVMALFPAKSTGAIDAAIAIQRLARGLRINIGVGIHTGPLVLGTIGERERFDTTVIADVVNIAARIEGLTKALGARILVSGQVADSFPSTLYAIRRLCDVQVAGASRALALYEIVNGDPEDLRRHKIDSVLTFERARLNYVHGDFMQAEAVFAELAQREPDDGPAGFLARRCAIYAAQPPERWNGVERFDVK